MSQYDERFYDTIAQGCIRSAETVVPIVCDIVNPGSVVDLGCGEGHWLYEFQKLGCEVLGLDGDYVSDPRVNFRPADLSKGIPDDLGRFDLAVSLEVAEHLPESRAKGFVDDLCSLSDTVLFSAAIPFQSGTNHINCQWQSYWVELFEANEFKCSEAIRFNLWSDKSVEVWYRQNMFLASRALDLQEGVGLMDVVHPEMHYWGRQ